MAKKRTLLSTQAFMQLWQANQKHKDWNSFYEVFKTAHAEAKKSIPTEHQINMRCIKIGNQMERAGFQKYNRPAKPSAEKKKPPTIAELLNSGLVKAKRKPKQKDESRASRNKRVHQNGSK